MFPHSFLDELTARNDIVEVVGSYVPLTLKGGSYWGCCPFHNEKTPSFHVLPDRQFYHCFGCKKGGGVINFIMEIENLSYPDAVRFLAKRVNLDVPEDRASMEEERQRKRLLELNREAARWFYEVLQGPEGAGVRAYLDKRAISRKIAVRFGMGASPNRWDALLRTMTARGYSKQELLTAGLIVSNKNGAFYDKFRNRLMLPVIDVRGDVVGFGSRVIDKSEPKYMNSTETPVYSKRRVLYGLNLAKKTKRPNMILCEGNLDVVTLHQAGFDNAVASMGTALTIDQIRLLGRYTKELVLCYDNDNAGQQATQRALELLKNTEFTVRVLNLPKRLVDGEYVKQDADDFIKFQGAPAFERLLSGSENGVEFRMSQVAAKYDLKSDQGRIDYTAEISQVLSDLSNAVEREVYAARAAELAGISPEAMRQEVERSARTRYYKGKRKRERRDMNPAITVQPAVRGGRYSNVRSAMAEEGIIRLLYLEPTLFGDTPPLAEEEFSSPLLGRIFAAMWPRRYERTGLSSLTGELSGDEMSHLTTLLQKPESTANAPQALADYIRVIREEQTKRDDSGVDPLLLAQEKFKDKKRYGGKRT